MKRLLVLVSMICIMFSVSVSAEEIEEFTSGDFHYIVLEDGTAEITNYTGNAEELDVPSELEGRAITSIGEHAFGGCGNLSIITLPEGIKSIGDSAFQSCTSLSNITIPNSIETMGVNPFRGEIVDFSISLDHPYFAVEDGVLFSKTGKKLIYFPDTKEEYAVPEGIQSIGIASFAGCSNLSSITLSESVQSVEDNAFSLCSNLSNVSLPEGIKSIGNYAFSYCDSLSGITLPDSIETMGANPFVGDLIDIHVSLEHPYLAVIDGVLFCKPDRKLIYFPDAFEYYSVPEGIQSIGTAAFLQCRGLNSITLPESVKIIENDAFRYCWTLSSITLQNGLDSIGDYAFSCCENLSSITLREGLESIGYEAFSGCKSLSSISLPEGLTSIGNGAFCECESLISITLPEGLTSLFFWTFQGCPNLSSITLPKSLTYIDPSIFHECKNLTAIVYLNSYAAEYCKAYGVNYTYADANDWLNAPSENNDSDQGYFDTTFTSSSGNIGNATVSLERGFDFINTDSSIFNYELALTAVTLSSQVYKSAQGRDAEEILTELGYDDTDFRNVDSSFAQPGVCFGYKQLEDGKNIFVAVVRGTDTTDDLIDVWTDIQDGALAMFRVSGDYVEIQLEDFMENATGKTKAALQQEDNYFFFTGHSLGGAVANYLSVNKDVMKFVNSNKGKIYTYTFEPPHTCEHLLWTDPESESNALNYKVDGDAVTNMPPYPGSTTYGKDEWIRVSELNDDLFNELFPDSKCKSLAIATSEDGHGDIFGLHDVCLDLIYVVQQQYGANNSQGYTYSEADIKIGYVDADELNVRAEPDILDDDNVMFTLSEGDEVKILLTEGEWYQVEVDGKIGWVLAEFVE